MLSYLARRILISIPTLLILTVIVFLLQKLLPGDIATVLAGDERDQAAIAAIRARYHLDDPIWLQYYHWLLSALGGDLGQSIRATRPVLDVVLQKLPITLQLACYALIISLAIGIPAGIVSAVKKGTAWDYVANVVALSGISIPSFWLGIMLILIVSVQLQWLPSGGYVSPGVSLVDNTRHLLLPSLVLGGALAGTMMRHTRSAMLTVLRLDYVRTARAKGLGERTVILKHALRNALIPIITLGTLQFGQLMAGAVLTEQVFNIPGFGKLIVDAVFNRDYAMVQGVVIFTGVFFMFMTLLADVGYFLVNPKLRR